MKLAALVLASVFALSAQAAAPKYDRNSAEILGEYSSVPTSCEDVSGTPVPCTTATIKNVNGNLVLHLLDYGQKVNLVEGRNGRLVFSMENPDQGDCDDPGCWNLLGVKGVVYPKKQGRKYIPAIKATIIKDYPFPDEEDAPEGETLETEKFIKKN